MKVFVTGATGALGKRVVPLLVAAGHEVTGVGRTPEKRAQLERQGAFGMDVDLLDADAVRRAVGGRDAIINIATAMPKPPWRALLPWAWHDMDRVRREVSATLVDAARADGSVQRFVQESFAPIYADAGDGWIDESSPIAPARYNRSVLEAEESAARFTRGGRTGLVLRFGLFYGPGDAFTQQMIDTVRRGWSPVFGAPEGYLAFISHEDAASAVVASLGAPAGTYNVVEHEPMRRRELADGMAALLGVRAPRFMPAGMGRYLGAPGETLSRSQRVSSRKLEQATGWRSRRATTLDGMRVMLAESRSG